MVGVFWERMVRSVKDLLRRSNGPACLDYEELETSLAEIESVITHFIARPISTQEKEPTICSLSNFLIIDVLLVQIRSQLLIYWLLPQPAPR